MNRSELIDFIANQNSISKVEADKAINMFTSGIIGAVSEGNDVSLVGFGNFTISAVEARAGINPKTKEPLQIEAYSQVRFKVGQKLKDAANSGEKENSNIKKNIKDTENTDKKNDKSDSKSLNKAKDKNTKDKK